MLSGKEIREYRERWGLSLRGVAEYCDVNAQYIGEIERGEKNPTYETYKKIMDGINKANFDKNNKATLKTDDNKISKVDEVESTVTKNPIEEDGIKANKIIADSVVSTRKNKK